MALPIDAFKTRILDTIASNPVTVIAAETGAGKSTQIPLFLLEKGYARIAITQPRRVAAMTVAEYVAKKHGTPLGTTIGYQIGGERQAEQETLVRFVTEGIILNQLHSDPSLRRYQMVIVDEAHERGVNQDLLLALLKRVRQRRPDLKIVIMSATIDEDKFSTFFGGAPVVKVPGRTYPVEIRYREQESYAHPVDLVVAKIREIAQSPDSGDILSFLPDEDSIRKVVNGLERLQLRARILPLYGSQAPEEQREVFIRNGLRRIIVSTNVAETSLTIDGVKHVVDSGLIKAVKYVDASMSALQVMEHSQAGCNQRAGRAGRTASGYCHRLYTREEFEARPRYTEPEIKRMTLDQVLLHLLVLGYSLPEVKNLELMDAPDEERWDQANSRLLLLGAVTKNGTVTPDGRLMDKLPLAPMLGRMLLTACQYNVGEQAAIIAAGLTSRNIFVRPRGQEQNAAAAHAAFKNEMSDGFSVLDAYLQWTQQPDGWARDNYLSSKALQEIERNRRQIVEVLRAESLLSPTVSKDRDLLRKAICAGLIVNLCVRNGLYDYRKSHKMVYIHPGSTLSQTAPEYLVCAQVVETTKPFARDCTALEPAWLEEIIPADACTTTWGLERVYFSSNGETHRLVRKISWQGMEIKAPVSQDTILPEALSAIVDYLVGQTIQYSYPENHLHPAIAVNSNLFSELPYLIRSAEETQRKIRTLYLEKVQGLTTLSAIKDRDLYLDPADWLTPEQLAERQAALQRAQQFEETRLRENTAEQTRRLALKQKINQMLVDLRNLDDQTSIRLLGDLSASLDYSWYSIETLESKVEAVARQSQRWAELQKDRIVLSTSLENKVLETYPVCPVCGSAWSQRETGLYCHQKHNLNRRISLTGEIYTARLETDRGESAADLLWDSYSVRIDYATLRGRPWMGKKFKKFQWLRAAIILPESLIPDKDQLLKDIKELKELKLRTASIESQAADQDLIRLTFGTIDGVSACVKDGIRYQASFTGNYPAEKETWYCRKGEEKSSGGDLICEVFPLIRITSTPRDVEDLQQLLLETYPGVPEELFV